MEEIKKYLKDNDITHTIHDNMITYEGYYHWHAIQNNTLIDIKAIKNTINRIKSDVQA